MLCLIYEIYCHQQSQKEFHSFALKDVFTVINIFDPIYCIFNT